MSCGGSAGTPFCPHCGERRAADRRYSLLHFAGEAFETITNADGTILRTIVTLVRRPGELTRAYMAGIRTPYLRPLQLFLLVNVVYFVAASAIGLRTFDTPLRIHMRSTHHRWVATRLVEARLAERRISRDAYARTFDQLSTLHAKSLVIAMVPMWAVAVALVQLRRRRYLVQHLVFALHFYAALLLISVAGHLVVGKPLTWALRRPDGTVDWQVWDDILTLVLLTAEGIYLALALRRAYDEGRTSAALKAVLLVAAVMVVLFLYRALLFFTVFWAT